MMPIRCLIIDDEPLAQKIIERYAKDIQSLHVVRKCKNAFEALEALRIEKIDLLFLDINMPKLSGMEFIRGLPSPPLVIITTAYQEYALEGYELDVVDYLKKPFSFERFLKAFQKAQTQLDHRQSASVLVADQNQQSIDHSFIMVKVDSTSYRVNLRDICCVEAMGNYVKIHLQDRTIVSYISLKKMQLLLPAHRFPRIHKSYIISLSRIVAVDSDVVVLDQKNVPIGHSYRQNFLALIQQNSM